MNSMIVDPNRLISLLNSFINQNLKAFLANDLLFVVGVISEGNIIK